MKSIVVLGLVLPMFFSTLAWANGPVTHQHNGRTHTHVLPGTGLNHSHGSPQRPAPQPATSSPWIYIGTSTVANYGSSDFYAKVDSLQKTKTHYSVIIKLYERSTSKIFLGRWAVAMRDCHNQMGVVNTYSLSGSFLTEIDFAFGAGNMGSTVAENLCTAGARLR